MNDISIDFYLMNNKNERLDLIEGEFNLFINNIKSSSKLEYDDYAIASKLVNVLKDNFIGEDISLNGAIGTSKKLKHVDNFLLKQKQNFKLFFTNNRTNETKYCYVDLEKYSSDFVGRYDEFEVEISLIRTTNWIKEKKFSFSATEDSQNQWKRGNKRPIIFGSNRYRIYDARHPLTNEGHEDAPFSVVFSKGATALEWELLNVDGTIATNEDGIDCKGRLNFESHNKIYLNTKDSIIYTDNEEVSQLRDEKLLTFFNVPLGNYILVFKNTNSDYGGILYEQYKKF